MAIDVELATCVIVAVVVDVDLMVVVWMIDMLVGLAIRGGKLEYDTEGPSS